MLILIKLVSMLAPNDTLCKQSRPVPRSSLSHLSFMYSIYRNIFPRWRTFALSVLMRYNRCGPCQVHEDKPWNTQVNHMKTAKYAASHLVKSSHSLSFFSLYTSPVSEISNASSFPRPSASNLRTSGRTCSPNCWISSS